MYSPPIEDQVRIMVTKESEHNVTIASNYVCRRNSWSEEGNYGFCNCVFFFHCQAHCESREMPVQPLDKMVHNCMGCTSHHYIVSDPSDGRYWNGHAKSYISHGHSRTNPTEDVVDAPFSSLRVYMSPKHFDSSFPYNRWLWCHWLQTCSVCIVSSAGCCKKKLCKILCLKSNAKI